MLKEALLPGYTISFVCLLLSIFQMGLSIGLHTHTHTHVHAHTYALRLCFPSEFQKTMFIRNDL